MAPLESNNSNFRTNVLVNGTNCTSKSAEQEAAKRCLLNEAGKLAYEFINAITRGEECPFIYKNPIYSSKTIIYEYAVKMNFKTPDYKTTSADKTFPVYVSSFVLDGKTYTGKIAPSKKEAEQLVACTAIESLLGSDSGTMARIIDRNKTRYHSFAVQPEILPHQQARSVHIRNTSTLYHSQQNGNSHTNRISKKEVDSFGSSGMSGARKESKRKAEAMELNKDHKSNCEKSFKRK